MSSIVFTLAFGLFELCWPVGSRVTTSSIQKRRVERTGLNIAFVAVPSRGCPYISEPGAADFSQAEDNSHRFNADHRSRHRQENLDGRLDALAAALPHVEMPDIQAVRRPESFVEQNISQSELRRS